ncbi:UDPglucose--hexose-1-phosphate uridylyltransferase [Halolactibacillus halophilus]|uniref:Galactose-1-phosphate uridylyltransferase n=1 Tax=Halolactibacillus halophilus TaxID=306540 RepID=A0A1I5RPW3_9BACI|nr:UDP-glucose--hexose-1-phosphate uridylyltransferase [Halolactibacillus halophilus]GEM02381.1 galactose-1-phosphate uridylyltransferase [Halolactibacillus halophilus]SFP60594.1 UDPglucose--hexose-1-phosphate uridylyltransferase [Halolactibacillus halophilus]
MVTSYIERLIDLAIEADLITARDRIYARNQILGLLDLQTFTAPDTLLTEGTIPECLKVLLDDATKRGVISDALDEREQLDAKMMDTFLSKPTDINATFNQLYGEDPKKATDYFYALSQNSHYIQTERIAKNIQYERQTSFGKVDITINLSKPEKDPKQIKRERELKQDVKYPQCLLCIENEGYPGRTGHPARSNHRVIDVNLAGEQWYFQYSPYVYYNEHSIVFCEEHRPMVISESTFTRLLSFVEQFPHYFIGSNADLPIVGGSILSHDHYQAGRYSFGMTEADDLFTFTLASFPEIDASVVNWPMSVIRLKHKDKAPLVKAGAHILDTWRDYSDEAADILAYTDETPHNTITPIARMRDGQYELDLVLRNNRTTAEHPDGLFHPHQDVHHIKKENIGLIEVMGLAVLPPRLKPELDEMKAYLLGAETIETYHKAWADELKQTETITKDNVDAIVDQALAEKFVRVLQDSGVFKSNNTGKEGFKRFLTNL